MKRPFSTWNIQTLVNTWVLKQCSVAFCFTFRFNPTSNFQKIPVDDRFHYSRKIRWHPWRRGEGLQIQQSNGRGFQSQRRVPCNRRHVPAHGCFACVRASRRMHGCLPVAFVELRHTRWSLVREPAYQHWRLSGENCWWRNSNWSFRKAQGGRFSNAPNLPSGRLV